MEVLNRLIGSLFSDLYITAFWGPFAVGMIFALFSRRSNNNKTEKELTIRLVKEKYIKHIIEIQQPSLPLAQPQTSSQPSNNELVTALVAGLLFISFFYAKYQAKVILIILGLSTFLLAYLGITIILSIKNNISHKKDWKWFLIITFGLIVYAYPLMYFALHPLYFPERIESMSLLFTNGGVVALLKSYGIAGFGFLLFQTLGFIALVSAQLIQFLSITFYTSITHIVISEQKKPLLEFVARSTKRFSSPLITIVVSIFLYIFSTIFISGIAYKLFYHR